MACKSIQKFIHALSNIFHPIIRLSLWRDLHTEPEIGITILHPHHPVELEFLMIQFGRNFHRGGMCVVYASHRQSDDGRVGHIQLAINARTATVVGKFTRMVLQVRLRDADTDEVLEIIDYVPSNSTHELGITPIADGMTPTKQLEGDFVNCSMRDDLLQWDWQHKSEANKYLGVSQRYFFEISIRAVRLVKAEFRLVSHFQDDGKVAKRSIPHREGTFVKQFLQLEDV